MTIIEFFDFIPLHNALSTLLLAPENLILFGFDAKKMEAFSKRLQTVITMRKLPTRICTISIPHRQYETILAKLESIVRAYPDCAFDLTGGETEILVAMGALAEKYGVPMHTLDAVTGSLTALTKKEFYPAATTCPLTIRENATLYGGYISEMLVPSQKDAFWQDILSVWSVARNNCSAWNTTISLLHSFCAPEDTSPFIALKTLTEKTSPSKAAHFLETLRALSKNGCLTQYVEKGNILSFRYKSRAVQEALSKEGTLLELYTYFAACIYPKKQSVFSDGAVGVVLNWDAPLAKPSDDVIKNEIDVFLMHGLVPVFISCKNGFTDTDELYKLSVVAERFGGPYALKCIVLSQYRPDASFSGRARELGIFVIQNANMLSPSAFSQQIINLVKKHAPLSFYK